MLNTTCFTQRTTFQPNYLALSVTFWDATPLFIDSGADPKNALQKELRAMIIYRLLAVIILEDMRLEIIFKKCINWHAKHKFLIFSVDDEYPIAIRTSINILILSSSERTYSLNFLIKRFLSSEEVTKLSY